MNMIKLFTTSMFVFSTIMSCSQSRYSSDVLSIADSLAYEYINDLNVKDLDTLYIYVQYSRLFENRDLVAFSIHSFVRPHEDMVSLPFHYSRINSLLGKNYITFHFDSNSDSKNNLIIDQMRKEQLLVKYKDGIVPGEDWKFVIASEEAWHVFLCKRDLSKLQLVKSFVSIEEEKPDDDLCN